MGVRPARVPLLMAAAAMLAIWSFEVDRFRMKEENNAFWMGNSVTVHKELASVAILLGVCSMVLCGFAWRYTKHRVLVSCLAALLIPIAFQLYMLVLFVLMLLGYRGPMP
jgi:hypothetical protein